jgi:DNA repair protein RadC
MKRQRYKQINLVEPLEKQMVKLVTLKMVVCENIGLYSKAITSCGDALEILRPLFDGAFCEKIIVICLSNLNCPTAVSVVNVGNVNESLCSPGNIFKTALLANSTGIILAHNHPGGSLSPSEADKNITEKIKKGGGFLEIQLLDHIIIAGPKCEQYYSFREHNLL